MIGERENTSNYGTLVMRAFNINGNDIHAFYDSADDLVFVLDNTIDAQKPNVLLVINSDGDKKWDEILSSGYGVDLETVRPKVDNKYQKLDIEYSGLGVYDGLIRAYNAGEDLAEHLNQLAILRDSATRHSAMMRLNVANETISKTNATIVRTKESIVLLQARVKTLRSKLSETRKEIGKVNTKQSAAKILKLESQIEATNEKLKRAKKRLESAQKRLDAATVDAELASALLNQPSAEIKQVAKSKPVMVAPEYPVQPVEADEDDEDIEETDIKPLFNEDPQILNEDIAFKPIEFEAPVFEETRNIEEPAAPVIEEPKPVLESMTPLEEPAFIPRPVIEEHTEIVEEKPVIETIQPVVQEVEPVAEPAPVAPVAPVVPVSPVANNVNTQVAKEHSKPGFVYYVLLFVLILLSVFTLWLYQKNMSTDTKPMLTASAPETIVVEKKVEQPASVTVEEDSEDVFLSEEPAVQEPVAPAPEKIEQPVEEDVEEPEQDEEPIAEPTSESEVIEDVAPVVMDVVPSYLNAPSANDEEKQNYVASEEDILATKPVYEPGAKYDDMFVSEDYYESDDYGYDESFDAEEAAYQEETNY